MRRRLVGFWRGLVILACCLVFGGVEPVWCETSDPDQDWNRLMQEQDAGWNSLLQTVDAEWQRRKDEQERKWREMKAAIEKKWDKAVMSTPKVWAPYRQDLTARAVVNFEKGTVQLEALIDAKEKDYKSKAQELIGEQLRRTFARQAEVGRNPLQDQLIDKKGRKITEENLETYVQEEVVPRVKVEERLVHSQDGVQRRKVTVRLDLVPQHIRIRAAKYMETVHREARRFGVDPRLVLAVIHTESAFNPMAVSPAQAYGLMQLIPRYGAFDAYRYAFGTARLLTPDELYDPETNIRLGTAYLALLQNTHFSRIADPVKRRYLVVCSYNWGPTAVCRYILDRHDVTNMSRQDLYDLLQRRAPQETRNYLAFIERRLPMYGIESPQSWLRLGLAWT